MEDILTLSSPNASAHPGVSDADAQSLMSTLASFKLNTHATAADVSFVVNMVAALVCLRMVLAGLMQANVYNWPAAFRWMAQLTGAQGQSKQAKSAESMWYTCWHSFSVCWALYVLAHEPVEWPQQFAKGDLIVLWQGLLHQPFTARMHTFYLVETAFWISCLCVLCFEVKRKDFVLMALHHIVTISLLSLSYYFNLFRVGILVLLIHDTADIFLYFTKILHYSDRKSSTDISFAFFALVFFVTRLVIYPFIVYATFLPEPDEFIPPTVWLRRQLILALPKLLLLLQCMHVMWFYMIARMIARAVLTKGVEGDIRSETDEELKNSANKHHRSSKKGDKKAD